MKKMIKPMLAFSLIIMGVIVLMKINRTWALNPEQNLDEASELKSEQNLNETSALNSKKNLNVEYFINNIDSDTTFIDLERDLAPFTGSSGFGFVRCYYETEGLIFWDSWLFSPPRDHVVNMFIVEDTSNNYEFMIMYGEKDFKSSSYIKGLFDEKKITLDVDRVEIKPKQFFDLNYEYTYADIVNLYGKPHGITDNNRIYYHINSYYVFLPIDFSSNSESKLNYIDVYSENGKFKCRIQYAPRLINGSVNVFVD